MKQCIHIDNIRYLNGRPNISRNCIKHLLQISSSNDVIINIADKNLGLCINDVSWYVHEYSRHLSDIDTYQEFPYDDLYYMLDISISNLHDMYFRYFDNLPKYIHKKDIKSFYEIKSVSDIRLPSLNLLPKPHKLKSKASPRNQNLLKSRPIVNGFNTVITHPSRLLSKLVKIFLNKLKNKFSDTYVLVNSSFEVVNQLDKIRIDPYDMRLHFISFDFSSLYTSISNNTVFESFSFLEKHLDIDICTINLMFDLFNYIKHNAYFHIGFKRLFLQKQGLAMGSYDSADIANLVLFISEIKLLRFSKLADRILYMARYIDDGTLILHSSFDQIMFDLHEIKLNYPSELEITFNINKIQTQFLDIYYGIGFSTFIDGKIYTSIYQKPHNAYTYIHYTSSHPKHFFKGVISTECHRYRTRSSNALEYNAICKLFSIRLRRCGYPKKYIKKNLLF